MNEEQINEVMRLADEIADYAWKEGLSDGAYSNAKQDRECRAESRAALEAYLRTISAEPTFQQRIQPWMLACFGAEIAADKAERNHRFLEEALELVQATGCSAGEAHQLVDYVYGRPVGEPVQEIGGVMVTLAALCLAHGMDMHGAAETELARIWTKVEQIRAKQAAKPKHSPLPEMVVMAQNTFPINPNGASKWAHLQKHDGAQAIGVVFRTGTGSVGSLVDVRVVWADWLAHPNGSKPESVNAELLEALKDARHCIGIDRDTLVDCHTNPCTGYLDPDGALAKAEYDDVIDAADAAIARAESAIETPAKVSPCAGPHEVVTASAVTCPDCIAVIKHCRGVRIQPPKSED